MTKDEALKLALEALENAIAVRNGEGGTKFVDPLEQNAITAIRAALAQPAQEWSWVCNECGAKEFTSALSEADLEYLACAGCGCNEFHKEAIAQPDYRAVKTYHEGKPVYVSQPAQKPQISTEELVYMTGVHDGKVLEREACAKVCESYLSESPHSWGGTTMAAAIRKRGNT
jgi:hypothetical protein